MNVQELRSSVVELGYDLTLDGIERAFLDGVVTESESVEIADTLGGGNSEPEPLQPIDDSVAIITMGDTPHDAVRRFKASNGDRHHSMARQHVKGFWYVTSDWSRAARIARSVRQHRHTTHVVRHSALRGGGASSGRVRVVA